MGMQILFFVSIRLTQFALYRLDRVMSTGKLVLNRREMLLNSRFLSRTCNYNCVLINGISLLSLGSHICSSFTFLIENCWYPVTLHLSPQPVVEKQQREENQKHTRDKKLLFITNSPQYPHTLFSTSCFIHSRRRWGVINGVGVNKACVEREKGGRNSGADTLNSIQYLICNAVLTNAKLQVQCYISCSISVTWHRTTILEILHGNCLRSTTPERRRVWLHVWRQINCENGRITHWIINFDEQIFMCIIVIQINSCGALQATEKSWGCMGWDEHRRPLWKPSIRQPRRS